MGLQIEEVFSQTSAFSRSQNIHRAVRDKLDAIASAFLHNAAPVTPEETARVFGEMRALLRARAVEIEGNEVATSVNKTQARAKMCFRQGEPDPFSAVDSVERRLGIC